MDEPTVDHDAIPVGREDEQIHVHAALLGGDVADALHHIAHELRTANLIAAAQLQGVSGSGAKHFFTTPVVANAVSDIADRLGISAASEPAEDETVEKAAGTRAFRRGEPVNGDGS